VTDAVVLGFFSDASTAVFWLWVSIQGLVCVLGGIFQGIRRRGWAEVIIIGAGAAAMLAFTVWIAAETRTSGGGCSGQGCDTGNGLGSLVLYVLATPLFAGVAAVGRIIVAVIMYVPRAWKKRT
jgi:hypothetical protein